MPEDRITRRLAAILAADVAGYSRLMGADEEGTLRSLEASRAIIDREIADHDGRLVGTAGDSVLAEFASVTEAVRCALDIQRALRARNQQLDPDRRMLFRIGVNLGDVMVRDGDIFGDGVNIAARLEALAERGGVCISGTVFEHVRNRVAYPFEALGEVAVKNIDRPVSVFRADLDAGAIERSAHFLARAGLDAAHSVAGAGRSSVRFVARAGTGSVRLVRRVSRPAAIAAVAGAAVVAAGITVAWYETPVPEWLGLEPEGAVAEPSIAVLPFANLGGDADDDYFADGLTEDIITELSRFSELLVFARNTSFHYRSAAADVVSVGEQIGARYVLEGSVRRTDEALRITAQLIETETGGHVWANHYDVPLEDVFAVQDQVIRDLVGALGITVKDADHARALRKPPDSLEAYDLVLRAREYRRDPSPASLAEARERLERAVALAPLYAPAHAWLAQVMLAGINLGFDESADGLERALAAARRAVELDGSNAWAHFVLAKVYFRMGATELYQAEVERAQALNPNDADILAELGAYRAAAGDFEGGVAMVRRAARIDPNHPNWFHFTFFFDHYRNGDDAAALAEADKLTLDGLYWTHVVKAAVHGQLGNHAAAAEAAARIEELNPGFAAHARAEFERWFADPVLLERMVDGLAKAGIEIADAG